MFISHKRNSAFLLAFFLTSCRIFFPVEPVAQVNDRFKADYSYSVNKAKKRHQKAIEQSNYDGTVSLEKTAYGKIMQNRLDFIESNAKNNPYVSVERSGEENLKYLSYNHGPYVNQETDIFANMKMPKSDFKYYYLGDKEYDEVSNIELQNSYDYLYVVNQEKLKQIEIARLKEEAIQQQQKKDEDLIKKSKSGFKSLVDKIKGLLQ